MGPLSVAYLYVLQRELVLKHGDIAAAFTNLSKLAMILAVLPVTTATVERSFSSMKLIKTRLRIRMGEHTLESTKHICIEGSDSLDGNTLEDVVNHYKAEECVIAIILKK